MNKPSEKAANTRLEILQTAFGLIYGNGYRTTSVDEIIAQTDVTKGAFYYHFKNKDEMGLAMIAEVMAPGLRSALVEPLVNSDDPVRDIYRAVESLLIENSAMTPEFGCPAANITQEMASHNDDFRKALSTLTSVLQNAMQTALENGKTSGKIKADVDAAQVAQFVMSGYWGIRNFGKLDAGASVYGGFLSQLRLYLKSLV